MLSTTITRSLTVKIQHPAVSIRNDIRSTYAIRIYLLQFLFTLTIYLVRDTIPELIDNLRFMSNLILLKVRQEI